MTEFFGQMARPVFVTRHSPGTAQLAQLLKCIILSTRGEHIVLAGVDKDGEPTEVNDYCTMFVEKFPCEGNCWKGLGEPPLTDHVTIMSPSLVASVCTEFGCGAFFFNDSVHASEIAGMPYEDQKAAIVDTAFWFTRIRQNEHMGRKVRQHRKESREYKRKTKLKDTWNESKHDGDEACLPTSRNYKRKPKEKPAEPKKRKSPKEAILKKVKAVKMFERDDTKDDMGAGE